MSKQGKVLLLTRIKQTRVIISVTLTIIIQVTVIMTIWE